MDNQKIHVVLHIQASAEDVWSALTDPNQTSQYWGGGTRVESEWQPGSKIRYRRDGKTTDEHTVVDVSKPERLVHTFEPQFGEFEGEKPSHVTFTITQSGEITKLELTHDNFEENSEVFKQCSGAWPMILSSLKTLLETGDPLPEPPQG